MRKYEIVQTTVEQLIERTCSVCGRNLMEDSIEGNIETQEAIFFGHLCGYGSVFGDGKKVYIDLCQHCFKEKLGEYCTIM